MVIAQAGNEEGKGGCPLGSLAGQLAETDPHARALLAGGFGQWQAAIGEGLRRLHQAGQLPDTTDPDALAVTLLATLQGGLLLAQVQRDPRPLETAVDTLLQLARSGGPISRPATIEQLRAELQGRWRQAARAVMVLLSLHGLPPAQIAALLDCHPATVRRWTGRFNSWLDHLSRRRAARDGRPELTDLGPWFWRRRRLVMTMIELLAVAAWPGRGLSDEWFSFPRARVAGVGVSRRRWVVPA